MKPCPSSITHDCGAGASEISDLDRLLDDRAPVAPRINSILLPIALTRLGDALVQDAVKVANLFGARLIGVAGSAGRGPPAEGAESEAAALLARASAARFAALSRPVNARCQWVEGEGPLPSILSDWAWSADLVMLARPRTALPSAWRAQVRDLLHRARRPILVRAAKKGCSVLDHIVLIWNETAAAEAATHAALPFLGKATTVTLLAPPWRRHRPAREAALDRVRRGLRSRNIIVDVARRDHRSGAAGLSTHLADLDPDLVVAAMPSPWSWRDTGIGAAHLDQLSANLLMT